MFILSLSCFFLLIISIQSVPMPISAMPYNHVENPKVESQNHVRIARTIVRDESKRWPSNEIPYEISPNMTKEGRDQIYETFQIFHKRTCVRFVHRTRRHRDFIYFNNIDEQGCYSNQGRTGGKQTINLPEGCLTLDTIAHEIMHAFGFIHEQNREDRDNYVKIHYGNIKRGKKDQFDKEESDDMTLPFDFNSVMLYGPNDFAKNENKPTMTSKVTGIVLKENEQLDLLDLLKINFLFKCIPGMENYRYMQYINAKA